MKFGEITRRRRIVFDIADGRNRIRGWLQKLAELWPASIVVPAGHRIALTVCGRDYEFAKSTGARLSNLRNELLGCGPFLHDDPRDQPAEVFGGNTTLHFGAGRESYWLPPVVPKR